MARADPYRGGLDAELRSLEAIQPPHVSIVQSSFDRDSYWSMVAQRRERSGATDGFVIESPDKGMPPELRSEITCPHCQHRKIEGIPTDACQVFYECEACRALLRPKVGDCCVFCSYGTVPCPPVQLERYGRGRGCRDEASSATDGA